MTNRVYSTQLPPGHSAIPFMRAQRCYSDTLRVMLEDMVIAGGQPVDYPSIPQAERLRRYFHVYPQPSLEERRNALLRSLDGFIADETSVKRLLLEAEYARLWRKFAENTVPKQFRGYAVTYIALSARNYMNLPRTMDLDVASELQRHEFVELMQQGDKRLLEYSVDQPEHDAITLLLCLYDAWDMVAEPDMTLSRYRPDYERLCDAVLGFLRRYYTEQYGLPGTDMDKDEHE